MEAFSLYPQTPGEPRASSLSQMVQHKMSNC